VPRLVPSLLAALALPAALLAHGVPHARVDAHAALHGAEAGPRLVAVHADPATLARHQFDLARHGSESEGEAVHVVAGPRDLARLDELGLRWEELGPEVSAGRLDDDWNSLADIQGRIQALVAENADIMKLAQVGTSIEGRPIHTVRVSSTPCVRDPSRPKVAINANHHAREVMTVEAALDVLQTLAADYRAGNAEVVSWVDLARLEIDPLEPSTVPEETTPAPDEATAGDEVGAENDI